MGLAEGSPGSIRPDHMGRADFFGEVVNEAARIMDAGVRHGYRECGADGNAF